WSVRAKQAGYRLAYVPSSIVYHNESSTVGKVSPTQQYYCTRNNLLFMKKHAPWYIWSTFIPFFLAKVTAKALIFTGFGQPRVIRSLVKGVYDMIRGRFGRQPVN
ncbi:MAG: hypothetical protein M0Z31_00520, partial [Clostridia bacterium]|nr:hypothetical protein [Clostridia bacterium]